MIHSTAKEINIASISSVCPSGAPTEEASQSDSEGAGIQCMVKLIGLGISMYSHTRASRLGLISEIMPESFFA